MLRTLIFTILVPGTVTALIPYLLLSAGSGPGVARPGVFRLLGLLPILVGAGIYAWCAWDFTVTGRGTPSPTDPPKELVAKGLYRFTRNPMYIGVCLVLLGEAIFFQSGVLFVYTLFILLIFHWWVVGYEEPTLRRLFGESYERYCSAVPRWVPKR